MATLELIKECIEPRTTGIQLKTIEFKVVGGPKNDATVTVCISIYDTGEKVIDASSSWGATWRNAVSHQMLCDSARNEKGDQTLKSILSSAGLV